MKKICIIVNDLFSGGGDIRTTSYLANHIAKDHDVVILSIQNNSNLKKPIFDIDARIKVHVLTDRVKNYHKAILRLSLNFLSFFRTNRFDSIIVSGMDFMPFIFLSLPFLKRSNKIAWEHLNHTVGKSFGLKGLGRKIALKYFDHVVVLSDKDVENYSKSEKHLEKIIRIYNPTREDYNRETVEYNYSSKRIMSAGFLTYQKGFDYALEIAEMIIDKHPDWVWDIYGDGDEREWLEKRIKERGLEKFVFLKGYTNNILYEYSEHSIFALTSRYEGFGMVVIEALSKRLPVVAFDIDCGPSDMIDNGINGFLVEPFDIYNYAKCLSSLMDSEDLRKRFSEKSGNQLGKLDMEGVMEQWDRII